jgi:Rrf2 family transcriptional regulator, nitric oxide-sensitive transcriptional repressor
MTGLFNISEALSIGLHLGVSLTRHPDEYCSTRRIADEFGFSVHHVAKVVQKLVRGGILETVRGIQGGARLAGDPAGITLLAIAEALDETPSTGCLLNASICAGGNCVLGREIRSQNEHMRAVMGRTTLSDVVDSLKHDFTRNPIRDAKRKKRTS